MYDVFKVFFPLCVVLFIFLIFSSSGALAKERRLSQDLIYPVKKEHEEFRSIFQHIQAAQLRRSPSELFAQHIVTIVHHIKGNSLNFEKTHYLVQKVAVFFFFFFLRYYPDPEGLEFLRVSCWAHFHVRMNEFVWGLFFISCGDEFFLFFYVFISIYSSALSLVRDVSERAIRDVPKKSRTGGNEAEEES